MPQARGILIVGGYGVVGRRIVADLAPDYPGRVIVAGRDTEKAKKLASTVGHGVSAARVDVTDRRSVEAALDGVGVVVSCVRQPETPYLLFGAVSHGCGYADLAPMSIRRPRYPDALSAEATRTGARIILGAGIAPGISNMFARFAADRVGPVDSVATTILLSIGDDMGRTPTATSWTKLPPPSPFWWMAKGYKPAP